MTILVDMMYDRKGASSEIAKALFSLVPPKASKYEPVFVFVGASTVVGDALAPLVGHMLKKRGYRGKFVGDLDRPVQATNLRERIGEPFALSLMDDKLPYVIGVDAAVGHVGRITVNDVPLRPGAGAGKTLPDVGKANIMASTAIDASLMWVTSLGLVMNIAEVFTDAICEFYDAWSTGSGVSAA